MDALHLFATGTVFYLSNIGLNAFHRRFFQTQREPESALSKHYAKLDQIANGCFLLFILACSIAALQPEAVKYAALTAFPFLALMFFQTWEGLDPQVGPNNPKK